MMNDSIFSVGLFGGNEEGHAEQRDTQLVECVCVFAYQCCEGLILPCNIDLIFIIPPEPSHTCARSNYELANEMQRHVCHTPRPRGVWRNCGNWWAPVDGSLIPCRYVEGQSRQEKDRFRGENRIQRVVIVSL